MQFLDLLAANALLASASAWNTDVHNQIGFMAENFLSHVTTKVIQKILEPQYGGSIGRIEGNQEESTHQWHWIDSLDTPPAVCNTYYNRDCTKAGCIVSAIANQSMILHDCIKLAKSNKIMDGSNLTCSYALKFVTHFTSGLAQPLHTSNLGAGGNAFNVSWGGKTNNSVLHSIWDGAIIYSRANKTSLSNMTIDPYFTGLTKRIRNDNFFTPIEKWLSCTDPTTPVACAMEWASDSNIWNCDYVYSQDFTKPDLKTSGHFEGAYPIVEIQMSKAALRLATWFNALVDGRYDEERDVILRVNPAWGEL